MPLIPIVGIEGQGFAKAEATFDTDLAFVSGDAIAYVDMKLTPAIKYNPSNEAQGFDDLITEVQGFRSGTFEVTTYMRARAAGTAPMEGALMTAAYGLQTIVGGTSVTYADTGTLTVPPSMKLARYATQSLFYEQANGCIIKKVEHDLNPGGIPVHKFSGEFVSYGKISGSPVTNSSTYSSSATTIVMSAASANKIVTSGSGTVTVAFGAENNGGTGYVATVAADGITLTITPGLANGIAASQAITPVIPSWSYPAGNILPGINGSLSIGGTSVGLGDLKMAIETGYALAKPEASTNRARFGIRMRRKVDATITVYVLDENIGLIDLSAWSATIQGTTTAIIARIGPNTTADRAIINLPASRFEVYPVNVSEKEAAMSVLKTVPRRNSVGDDWHNWVLT